MNCIVTAGPTYEELDDVRRMTNFSSGALGAELADFLVIEKHPVRLLRGHYSTARKPSQEMSIAEFTTSSNLATQLERMGTAEPVALFHAAAVSDFAFSKIWQRGPDGTLLETESRKFSTHAGTLFAELVPTPKIISKLREWFPNGRLIGWKYEVEGKRETILAAATEQLADNRTNVCVLNGPAYGEGFGIVTPSGDCEHVADKPALFTALLELIK